MSTAVIPATDSVRAEEFSSIDDVSDAALGHDILFGMLVGTPLTYLVVVAVCLAARIGVGNALAVAVVPCVLSGIFFGGMFPLTRQMSHHEAAERVARRAVLTRSASRPEDVQGWRRPVKPLVQGAAPASTEPGRHDLGARPSA